MPNQNQCPRCGGPTKTVPAGVSKTKKDAQGNPKAYSAFEACIDRECKPKPKPDGRLKILQEQVDVLEERVNNHGKVIAKLIEKAGL